MIQLKYPPLYFNGLGLDRYPPQLLQRAHQMFDEQVALDVPLVGETGIDGVLLDFNCGLRLQIPEGNWHVRIADAQSELVFIDADLSAVTLISMEKFYIEWEIALWFEGEPVFYHQFEPEGQLVHFVFGRAIGDSITLLPYVEQFRRAFDCEVSLSIGANFRDIVRNYFPHIRLSKSVPEDTYATFYTMGWMYMPLATPSDVRAMPLELFGQTILNTPKLGRPSKVIYKPTKPRSISKPYVCIGVQASGTNKCWLTPGGWDQVVEYLQSLGYRVLCIDRDRKCSGNGMTVKQPKGAEDFSGNYTLLDRVNQLAYADFFIGVSSGLAWLAWAVDIPVVLISAVTETWYEFDTPYRISNPLMCHGCFNDLSVHCMHIADCVRYKDTPRMYECLRSISARQVIAAIDQLIADRKPLGGST